MPIRSIPLVTGEIYHVYNRSVGHEIIFKSDEEYKRILSTIDFYRYSHPIRYSQLISLSGHVRDTYVSQLKKQKPIVDLYSFALMPNHFHLLIRQLAEDGIMQFLRNVQDSYAKYFNIKNNRHGSLFDIRFKAKRIINREQFIHISRYIHLNPVTAYLIEFKDLFFYPWNSFHLYVNNKCQDIFIEKTALLSEFISQKNFIQFVANQVDYQKTLQTIKHLILE